MPMIVRYSVLQMSGTTPKLCDSPPASGAQSVSKKKSLNGTWRKKSTASVSSVTTIPVVVRTDRRAAAASRSLMPCSPSERRVRVRWSDSPSMAA
jgi:hypothetical protein